MNQDMQAPDMQSPDTQRGRIAQRSTSSGGLVVREGEKAGTACRANAVLTDFVTRVGRGELKADPRHVIELGLNQSVCLP
jgi:2-dehydropantoate 2-reductase